MKKGQYTSNHSQFVTKHPWAIIFVTLLLVTAMAAGITNLKLKTDYRVYFSKENPELLAFQAMQDTYNKSDSVMFVLHPQEGTVFTPQVLQAIKELTEKSWQIPFSSRVDSITNFQHTQAEDDMLTVADLVTNTDLSATEINKIKQIALNEPFINNHLISPSGHVSGINVTLQLPGEKSTEATDVAEHARSLVKEIENSYPGMKVYLSGMAMMTNAFSESAMDDNATLVPIMYGVVILLLLFCLRSISATFAVVLLIVFSVLSTLGIAGWMGWFINPTSAISPTIIITMAVADCVHFLVTQLHNMRLGHEKKQAIKESLRVNFQPIFLTSITTAIGFLTMNFSDAPPFRDLGNLVAIGVVLALIFSITFLPAIMTVLPVRVKIKAKDELDSSLMKHLAEWVIKFRKPLLIFNGIIAIVLISFSPRNELNDEFVKYFDKTTEFRIGTDFLNENMGGIYTIELSIHALSQGGINEPEYLANVKKLSQWLLTQPEVVHVKTLTDTFKRLNRSMHNDDDSWYKLPASRELAAQYLLLYEMSLPYGLDLNNEINIDKSSIRVMSSLKSLSSNQMLALENRVKEWLGQNMADYRVELASPILMFSHIGKRNIERMIIGSLLALVLISLLLALAFKSVKLGLISLIPNIVPAGVAFGIWGLIDAQVGLGLSVVTGLTLGIVVDDTVHFISKYRRARLEKNMSSEDAVRYAFSTVGVALWITSSVLVSGFMILSLSHFNMNADMGLMTAITIAVALFLDLLLLPPLLMSLDKK